MRDSPATSIPLIATPPKILEKCRRFPQLQPACPTKVPDVDEKFQRANAASHGKTLVFFAEWNAPYPGLTTRNAPPTFAHVNAFAGDIQSMANFEIDDAPNKSPPRKRDSALSFGDRSWNGRIGDLLLAPSYPHGGMEGDHLIFQWSQEGMNYSLSLHAWEPLEETEATLKALVESLP